ncbi:MAG: galactose mutarotase [Flavobacterium sp.]|nr:MAG: galactose mutarotase [Flavobacterium sp.]
MKVNQTETGHSIDGKAVIGVELVNDKGTLVKIFNYGAIINKFIVTNKAGESQDIVLGFDDFSGYINEEYLKNYPYLGSIIGRYANRIKNGEFEVDGVLYQLAKNNGEDCLHGGKEGLDKKVWDIVSVSENPHASVTLQYYSLDGEENFPGDLAIQLTFQLTNNDELILSYQADTDEATPINLTHHGYFNLSPTGEKVLAHTHRMDACNYLEQDNFVVTGNLLPVKDTIHDFTTAKAIGANWNEIDGYDQSYVLDKTYGDLTLASKTSETKSGLTLLVYTTEPVAHFYTAKHLAVKNGKGGRSYGEFDAFCVETQHHPNAVNIPHFPSTILQPEEIYTQTTIYKIITN